MAISAWPYAARNFCSARIIGTAVTIAIVVVLGIVLPATWPAAANQDIFNKTGEPCTSCHVPPVSNGVLNPHGQDFKTKFFGTGGTPQVVQPTCPSGFTFDRNIGQCIPMAAGPAPMPQPIPQGGARDWYAIAISTKSQGEAQTRANQLGPGWVVKHTSQCPNMTPGYWIATAGGFDRDTAQLYVNQARQYGAYKKTCN